ncbi:MAG: hypothetical protein RIS94_3173 [Pseudomonadota bacterium]|jgi:hypothetical protein
MNRLVGAGAALVALMGVSALAWGQVAQTVVAAPAVSLRMAPPVRDVLRSGVLIVVSKPEQRMYVFRDGALWSSAPVSTGRRGHGTPVGVFPILQKQVFHRSNTYSNAPMPFMQRLTWRGIAVHAGHLPGYPASHGCIRVPYAFARALFGLTRAEATTVVVTDAAAGSGAQAVALALGTQGPRPVLAAAAPAGGQTIQLAAAPSPGEAEARWGELVLLHPELATFRKAVIPAVVGVRQVYRLRASAPGARAFCASLKRAGEDCFNVI